jgi:hypothetical protein
MEKNHPSARYAQRFAAGLAEAVGSRSYREIARWTGVSHGTISALLRGDTWPDLVTVQAGMAPGPRLWPGPLLFAEQVRGLRVMQTDSELSVARRVRFSEAIT